MQISIKGKLSDWEDIKLTIFKAVGRSDFESVHELENAIRSAGVETVNAALKSAGYEATVEL